MSNRKYEIMERIGHGAFGNIYKARNRNSGELVAMKFETHVAPLQKSMLKNEAFIYQYLRQYDCFPHLKWYGIDAEGTKFLVMTLLGPSLEDVMRDRHFAPLPLPAVVDIGARIVSIIQIVHDNHLLHRDIKPDSILFGREDTVEASHLFLIDFGLGKPYVENDQHIPFRPTTGFIGSYHYASRNAHTHVELSRRDDLESVIYLLLFLLWGTLPWKNATPDVSLAWKRRVMHLQCPDLPDPLRACIRHVQSLAFPSRPNYALLLAALRGFLAGGAGTTDSPTATATEEEEEEGGAA